MSRHPAARDHCLSLVRSVDRPTGGARYGRMFPGLEPLGADPQVLMRAGADGGICDAAAVLDPGSGGDDAEQAAGWPFFGQLLAHDTTAIGDPRNDVHLFSLTLHVALLRAHNRIVDRLRASGIPEDEVFERARITLTWHYQWVVVHDFLPRLVGQPLVDEVLTGGGKWFTPEPLQAFIPLEFADAAYRYGHGQIRHTYRLTAGGPEVPLFPDLVGFGPPRQRLDLTQVFDVPGRPPAQRAKRLDGRLPASLIGLPEKVTGAVDEAAYKSLAVRDLLRGDTTGLPSGEEVAELLGVPPLTEGTWPGGTPLWFYVLKESEVFGDGDRLGPVGGRIVAEVLLGLLRADPASYLSLEPGWQPTLPANGETFGLTDLLIPDGSR